jgi:tRNA (guanine37-N1)-methyltransferase
MRFHIVTIFPEMFTSYIGESIVARAQEKKLITISLYAIRDFTKDKHRKVDDRPYGGGPGMVMTAQPILSAVEKIKKTISKRKNTTVKTIIFSPGGKEFTNVYAKAVVKKYTDIILICGRYEGIDARVKKILKAEELSIGNYVLTGGELPAMVTLDAMSRQIKGVLGDTLSLEENRTSSHEMYTRPELLEWEKKKYRVPKVLLSGHAKNIEAWKKKTTS